VGVEIVLVRHAVTAETRTGRMSRNDATPLDDGGRAQADALGPALSGRTFDLVLASPVARAWETAQRAGLGGVAEACDAVVEWDYGRYAGRRTDDVRAEWPGWNLFADGAPEGESPAQVAARLAPVLDRLHRARGDVAIVAHGHLLRALVACWLELPLEHAGRFVVDPASITVLGRHRAMPALVGLNDRHHLHGIGA
jgi:probable phosphoglycerate mutase